MNHEYTKSNITAGTIMSLSVPLVTMLISLATVIIVWVGGQGVSSGTIEIGAIMGAISYSLQILMGFEMLTNVILSSPRGQISAKRIYEVLDMPISVNDPNGAKKAGNGALTFENVDFRYQSAERKTLENISFTVNIGQTLAIIGSTGEGKSSLVNLIPRLYDVEKGYVKIGGTDIQNLEQKTLHDLVSFSPQKSTLFFGTVRSNLLAGKPDATDEELWAALEMAHATEFVLTLPNGLDSTVEKGGGNFSGGQKQRLCIARALLKNAAIYIFDDSFSVLDFKTDGEVRRAMGRKLKDAITIIVAQRIDGTDIRNEERGTIRRQIGMVLQDTWLFSGTIFDNINYGNENATDEKIYAAAKDAYADDFIQKLPDGYNTLLNEDADNISQGQRQLITIARAFVSNPEILILDEATSNVDSRTEMVIQSAIKRLLKGRTSFVVAHRLSTIYDADRILVMDKGDIVEMGTHKELLEQNGVYADIYNSRFAQNVA